MYSLDILMGYEDNNFVAGEIMTIYTHTDNEDELASFCDDNNLYIRGIMGNDDFVYYNVVAEDYPI